MSSSGGSEKKTRAGQRNGRCVGGKCEVKVTQCEDDGECVSVSLIIQILKPFIIPHHSIIAIILSIQSPIIECSGDFYLTI